ncbi:MAG: carboxypeptidase regulatory-like domain-containing protein [Thermoanaerobaculia bacterium]
MSGPGRTFFAWTQGSARNVFLCLALLACASLVQAQVTTGSLAGTITAQDGSALPGVTIDAVHVPTGTHYTAVTNGSGRYTIPNVRVGGPYKVTGTLEGFRTSEVDKIDVSLGRTTEVDLKMALESVAESITVSANVDEIINPDRTGSTSAVSEQQIESLPTVSRSLQDFARTNPYFTVDAQDSSSTRMYVAGKNNRYNTIQIDGAVDNDLFGLADTGTPGGQADVQPISLEAIQELQLVVSPYDVRQGGFTGGGINAITRSGTNAYEGSAFYSKRDQQFVGDGPYNRPISDFTSNQYGGRFGGPILRDKLFFFVTGEHNDRSEPTGWSAEPGNITINPAIAAEAAAAKQIAIDKYGYDPGSLGDTPAKRDSNNYFGRFDWNIGNSSQLTLRHNYVEGTRDATSGGYTFFYFPTSYYAFNDKTNSTVAQLNSVFGPNSYNEARLGYQTIRDKRAVPIEFPSVEIGGAPRRGEVTLGTERFSGANSLDQDILEVTDDFTLVHGNHTITVGTHNEFFSFKNLFMSDAFGYYFFPTLEDFAAGTPTQYSLTYAPGSDPRRATTFDVSQYGLYASDQWRVSPNVNLVFGLRGDMPSFPDTPSFNPIVSEAIGYSTAQTPAEDVVWSPRLGFNWDPSGAGKQQLRGGIGIFAGRTPYVWVSNAYGDTGVEQIAVSCVAPNCTPQFVTDPNAQPTNFPSGGGAISVDLIDPNFQFPRVMRSTLGYDRELPWGIRGTAEVVYSKNLEDVYYENVNKVQTGTSPLDGRPTYSNISSQVRDAILLTNTSKGYQTMESLQLNKRFGHGFTLATSYAHQNAKSAFDGTSSRAISNWQYHHTQGDIFDPKVSRSAFETTHRFNLSASYNVRTGPFDHTIALYYNAQSGRPYSLLFGTDVNKDGYSTNDLLYVPGSADEIILQNASRQPIDYSVLADFLKSAGIDPTAGRILNRYESTEPWVRQLDFHYELGLPAFTGVRTSITADVLNLLNMFDKNSGVVRYVSNQNYLPVYYQGIDSATGKPIYRERFNGALDPGAQFSTADVRSRWQARLGLRVTF